MMLNLRTSVLNQYWAAQDPRMAKILSWMKTLEDWMLDENEEVADALYRLCERLDPRNPNLIENHSEDLLTLMAYLSAPRAIRLLAWMDEHSPYGMAGQLTELATLPHNQASGELFLDRLQTLRSLALLGRVFSPSRAKSVARILQSITSINNN
jgi:hypothetical protein